MGGDFPEYASDYLKELFMEAGCKRPAALKFPHAFDFPQNQAVSEKRIKAQVNIAMGYSAPDAHSKHCFAARILASALDGMGGRFYRILREQRGICYELEFDYRDYVCSGLFVLTIGTSPEKKGIALDGLREIIGDLEFNPLKEDEIQVAKNRITGSYQRALEIMSTRVFYDAENELMGLGYQMSGNFLNEIKQVTTEMVNDVVKKYITRFKPNVIIIEP
jgi:zinc protease